jgi:plastocyanin
VVAPPRGHADSEAAKDEYLPDATGSRIVTVARSGEARSELVVLTQALVTKEKGPRRSLRTFGETYAFLPSTLVMRAEEPTRVIFWNLQDDDAHDFLLADTAGDVLLKVTLPALSKRSWVFTFHQSGLMHFYCTTHQPEMSGEIPVLPPAVVPPEPSVR